MTLNFTDSFLLRFFGRGRGLGLLQVLICVYSLIYSLVFDFYITYSG